MNDDLADQFAARVVRCQVEEQRANGINTVCP